MPDRVGQQFGNYRLIRLLGQGEMGTTYLGEQIESKNKIAITVLDGFCYDEEPFLNEVRTIARLEHPCITKILDFGVKDRTAFLVTEYILNATLRQQYPKGQMIPLATIISYVKQIAEALQYVHLKKVLHRDIRPENMLVKPHNEILLGNICLETISTDAWERPGTKQSNNLYDYKAPEWSSSRSSPASDQYALGVVVYEWLCGDLPFKASNSIEMIRQHEEASPPSLREKVSTIPPAVEVVVMKALAKDPQQRFESVQAFADALEQAYLSSIRPKASDLVGQQFGNYRLTRLLGHGGFADVYLGQHRRLNTYAAIKVLHTHLSNDDLEGFQKEAQTIANLRHSSIVRVFDFDVEGDIPFLVMDHAPNGTLRQRHPHGSRLPLTTIVSYVKQLVNALQYAHDQKLIHRDVKPENMLLGPNNEVLLSDFGIAVVAHSTASLKTGAYLGTVHYSAPEQIRGKPLPASDQYALGIVVYEWLTGARPFSGSSPIAIAMQHLSDPPPPLRGKNSAIPSEVEQVVMTALAKDPKQRFASVQAFATALEQASQQEL